MLEEQALIMREAADNGDAEAVTAQLDILGSEGCGGCHKTFRQKLD
jgi:cytochrome c556